MFHSTKKISFQTRYQSSAVLSARHCLLGERKLMRLERRVAQLLPLDVMVGCLNQFARNVELVQCERKIKLVIGVGRYDERFFAQSLRP